MTKTIHPVYKKAGIKVYHGYGHTNNLIVYGHVFKKRAISREKFSTRVFPNIIDLLRLFMVKPLADARIRLLWHDEILEGKTEKDGFFRFEWKSLTKLDAGWHPVVVELLDHNGEPVLAGEGGVYIPHSTQYGFISDIDDTVMISHSATILKRLRELFIKNPHTRKIFKDVASHYEMLALAHTKEELPNPFFYVSSSEWNLYDYLNNFFTYNGLPKGAFLLNQVKQLRDLWKTGKTEHQGKLLRIVRIMEAFPEQQFIFFGDNSQQDPSIYAKVAENYPGRVLAVYIRNVRASKTESTSAILQSLESTGIKTCLFRESAEAIIHSRSIGLLGHDPQAKAELEKTDSLA